MQETQILLAQIQVTLVQLSLQAVATPALGLVWLLCLSLWVPALNPGASAWRAWLGLFERLVRLAMLFGLLWAVVMALAWPALLARVGSVLGPLLALSGAIVVAAGCSAWRGMSASVAWLRGLSVLVTALAYTAVMALLVVVQSWMRSPDGTALIDGRFQVLDWVDVILNQQFATQMWLTALAGFVSCLPFALNVRSLESVNPAIGPRQALAALGVLACIGLMILFESVVLWWSDALLGMSGLLLGESPHQIGLWLARGVLGALLITLLALLTVMLSDTPSQGKPPMAYRLTWLSLPMWLLMWWLMDASLVGNIVAGLPMSDVVSTRDEAVLATGVVGVSLFCLGALWLFGCLYRRDQSITAQGVS